MRIVYYKLPLAFGEEVLVMQEPFYECEVAFLMSKEERREPLFRVNLDGDIATVTPASDEDEPFILRHIDGLAGVIPAENQAEARAWALWAFKKMRAFDEKRDTHDD